MVLAPFDPGTPWEVYVVYGRIVFEELGSRMG